MFDKKQKITIIGLFALAIIFMVLGLIFIGVGSLDSEIAGIAMKQNGFDLIKASDVGYVLSSGELKSVFDLMDSAGQLNLIRCGIIFAVIFTPILAGSSLISGGYFYYKNKK